MHKRVTTYVYPCVELIDDSFNHYNTLDYARCVYGGFLGSI